jgi:hypothetical protein
MQEKNKRLVMSGFAINSKLSNSSFFDSLLTTSNSIEKGIFNKSKEKKTQVIQNNQLN